MPLFPLDSVTNAPVDRTIEPVLENVRERIADYPHWNELELGSAEDILEVFDLSRARLNILASILSHSGNKSCVDISTGLGFLPLILERLGIATITTECDPAVARFAREAGIEVRHYCIGRDPPPFGTESLNIVVLAEVLEHLKQPPISVLRELASLLVPGGLLLVTTPNIARLAHLQALAAGENFLEPFSEDAAPGSDPTDLLEHVREYSVREVVEAVEATGLAIERVLMTGWGETGYHPLASPYANEIIVLVARK